jgi:hypothetical protein
MLHSCAYSGAAQLCIQLNAQQKLVKNEQWTKGGDLWNAALVK